MRIVEVYPKAVLSGDVWRLNVKVGSSSFVHLFPSTVTVTGEVMLLKVVFILEIGDTDTDQDVDDMIITDDIKPGSGVETVWGNWQANAEAVLDGMVDPTWATFRVAQNPSFTNQMRGDAQKALGNRGWSYIYVEQHEGDGTSLIVDGDGVRIVEPGSGPPDG